MLNPTRDEKSSGKTENKTTTTTTNSATTNRAIPSNAKPHTHCNSFLYFETLAAIDEKKCCHSGRCSWGHPWFYYCAAGRITPQWKYEKYLHLILQYAELRQFGEANKEIDVCRYPSPVTHTHANASLFHSTGSFLFYPTGPSNVGGTMFILLKQAEQQPSSNMQVTKVVGASCFDSPE